MKKEVAREEVGSRSDGYGGDHEHDPQTPLLPDIGVCNGGQGHLFHKREVVREGENGEDDEGGRKERGEGGEKEEKDCEVVHWLGEPAPPPPKARLISSELQVALPDTCNCQFFGRLLILCG